jgi:DNA-binding transcriptional LysR family regulator
MIRFELAELETFLAVVRLGSFSLAAEELNVSQPSVTNRVKRLEETLHVQLLRRTTRSIEPTEDGIYLRDAAEQALKGLREVVVRFHAASEVDRNRVVVAATPMLAATLLPQVIHSYQAKYPDVQVNLLDLTYDQVIKSVAEGRAQIGVTALDGDQSAMRFQLLAEEDMLLVAPSRHPLANAAVVTLDDIAPYPMMFLERYAGLRDSLGREFAERGVDFDPGTVARLPTLLGMIDAGNCITFLPRSLVQNNARRTRTALTVTDFHMTRRYGSIVARKGALNTAAHSFHNHLMRTFEQTLNENVGGSTTEIA